MRYALVVTFLLIAGCQDYAHEYQPWRETVVQRIRWEVPEAPHRALIVIDNSPSAADRAHIVEHLLGQWSPESVSRIAITSTDITSAPCETCPTVQSPFDGRGGRLVSAYDPDVYAEQLAQLSPRAQVAFTAVAPTSSEVQDPVVDSRALWQRACEACDCNACSAAYSDSDAACFYNCAFAVTRALGRAALQSRMNALGTDGSSNEAGIGAALLALETSPFGQEDTTLSVAIASNEDDCTALEGDALVACSDPSQAAPIATLQETLRALTDGNSLRLLLIAGTSHRFGTIEAVAQSCAIESDTACTCLRDAEDAECSDPSACDALATPRYLEFAQGFAYWSESWCEQGRPLSIGPMSWVDLVPPPVNGDPNNILVWRQTALDRDAGIAPSLLPQADYDSPHFGWSYYPGEPGNELFPASLFLHGLEPMPGDAYVLEVLTVDSIDYARD